MPANKDIAIGFLLFPGFPMACLTSMIEPLRVANEINQNNVFSWKLVSETGGRVEASSKIWFDADLALQDCRGLDRLFILSAPASQFENQTASNGMLRHLSRHGVVLGAISGGIFPLARAGLLEGQVTSVHWVYDVAFSAEFPNLASTEDVFVMDGKCVTASGASAAFDLTLHLIEAAMDADIATQVACWFQHPLMRGQGVTQRKPSLVSETTNDMLPDKVRKAVDVFSANLATPVKISDVASQVGVSARQLDRQFLQNTGKTPLAYYRSIRMQKARHLLHYGKDSLLQIALAVGYSSVRMLSQTYLEEFGIRPAEDRKKNNMFHMREGAVPPQM